MHVLIVHANPEPRSFTGALRDAAADEIGAGGHACDVSDLFQMGFNPVAGRHDFSSVADTARFHYQSEQGKAAAESAFSAEIAAEQAKVARADVILFIFPLWWGGPPAILKGWLERVLAYGFAYVDGARFETGFFKDKRGLMAVATGGTTERFSEEGVYGPIEKVLWPVQRLALEYMGLKVASPFVAYAAPRVSDEQRRAYIEAWRGRVRDILT